MLSGAADTRSLGFKVTAALNVKGVLLLATSLWLLWGELESNCFPDVPQKEYKETVLPPLFLMAIISLYLGAFGIGLFKEALSSPVGARCGGEPTARFILGRISWLLGMLMFLYNLPFMLFVLKLGLKRFITDPETLDQDSEEVMEIFGMLLVEVMLGMRALAVCLLVALLLGFSRWMAIQENLDYVDAIPRVRSALAGRKVLSTPDLRPKIHAVVCGESDDV
mmetsp:Transcript_2265/g.3820  ORF Transcript_2265/g.3820 Transcript_2265/m.3820 type:complete len:223 (-) Transcript_2265:50-718(-)